MQDRPTAGRLLARPRSPLPGEARPPGLHALRPGEGRGGLLRVPEGGEGRPLPLLVMLHGAGGNAAGALGLVAEAARDLLVLLPESRGSTWDVILGGYGPDVAALDDALGAAFAAHPVDPARVALAGFSDGASYALSLGLANADLFSHLLAFSPGFVAPPGLVGQPRIFVSHGVEDEVLPIGRCSRRLVPRLRQAGYDVLYREFPGGHRVPAALADEALGLLRGTEG